MRMMMSWTMNFIPPASRPGAMLCHHQARMAGPVPCVKLTIFDSVDKQSLRIHAGFSLQHTGKQGALQRWRLAQDAIHPSVGS